MQMRFKTLAMLLCLSAMAIVPHVACAQEPVEETSLNPFIKPCVYQESLRAEWRHVFHHMRRTWDKYFEVYPKELEGFEPTTLDRMRAEPSFFLDHNVQIDVYWGKMGSIFRPFTAPFHEESFMNYGAWQYGSDIWQKEVREQVHPLFYVDRHRKELVEKLEHVPMYSSLHLWVTVRSKSENTPWIEIRGAEIIPETGLREVTLRHLELGTKQMTRKHYDLAAQAFENALKLQLPINIESRALSLLGRSYFELRLFTHARNAYAEALIRDGENVTDLIYMARADEQIRHPEEAREAAERAVTLAPSNPEARAELGLALAMTGDDKAGFRELDFAQKLAPRNQLPEANRNRAIIYIKQNKLELAKQELSQAVILRAADPVLHLELGDVLLTMNQLEDSKREFGFAKDLAPNRPEPYFKFAVVSRLQGDAAKKDNKPDDAKKFYSDALDSVRASLKIDDTNSDARGLELDMLKELGREKEAEKAAETALSRTPGNIKFIETMYESAAALKHLDVMERAATMAVQAAPDAKSYVRLANLLATRPTGPDLKAAATNYESAVKIEPENGSAWLELAQIRRSLNDVEGSIAAADKAAEITKSTEARTLAAKAHLERETADPVALDAAKALVADAKDDAARAQAQSILGAAQLRAGNVDAAVEMFSKADPLMKDNAEHQYWYGMALLQKNDSENAKARFKTVVDLSRNGTAQNAVGDRLSAKAMEQIEKLEPGAQKLPEPAKATADTQPKIDPSKPIRKVLPPLIEDDGPQPVPTDANRSR